MYGRPEYDPIQDKYKCEECNEWFTSIPHHVYKAHGISIDEYREKYGFDRNSPLCGDLFRLSQSKLAKEKDLASNLDGHRDAGKFKEGNKKAGAPRRAEFCNRYRDILKKARKIKKLKQSMRESKEEDS